MTGRSGIILEKKSHLTIHALIRLRVKNMCILLTNNVVVFSTNIYVVGTQKNRLIEMVLLSTHNICQTYVVGTLT